MTIALGTCRRTKINALSLAPFGRQPAIGGRIPKGSPDTPLPMQRDWSSPIPLPETVPGMPHDERRHCDAIWDGTSNSFGLVSSIFSIKDPHRDRSHHH